MPDPPEHSPVFATPLTTLFGSGARLSILQSFNGEQRTTADLATEHNLTRQNVNYHLKQLEAHGWIAVVDTRKPHTAWEPVWAETTQLPWGDVIAYLNALVDELPETDPPSGG